MVKNQEIGCLGLTECTQLQPLLITPHKVRVTGAPVSDRALVVVDKQFNDTCKHLRLKQQNINMKRLIGFDKLEISKEYILYREFLTCTVQIQPSV